MTQTSVNQNDDSESPSEVDRPKSAIVTCVEAGYLETLTIRMIQSLRHFGGRMSNIPVVVVTPRSGPPIARSTRRQYDQLGVTYVQKKSTSPYAWYNFLNKPEALVAAEDAVNVDSMIWLDADILILREPTQLLLSPNEDFTACAQEKNIGTTGPEDPFNQFWVEMCSAMGMAVDDLPWVTALHENIRIRAYFNCGVLSYRPSTGYGKMFLDTCHRLLDAKLALPKDGIFYHEQIAVSLAMVKSRLRFRELADSHNFHFGSTTLDMVDFEHFKRASVLHYHRFMQPGNFQKLLPHLQKEYPQIHDWLKPFGPSSDNLPTWKRILNKLARTSRKRKMTNYLATCRFI